MREDTLVFLASLVAGFVLSRLLLLVLWWLWYHAVDLWLIWRHRNDPPHEPFCLMPPKWLRNAFKKIKR